MLQECVHSWCIDSEGKGKCKKCGAVGSHTYGGIKGNMRLYEYEGKEIFKKTGIPIPQGALVRTPEEARQAATRIGEEVVVKSQILVGGRGKAGGIRIAKTPQDAQKIAQEILGMELMGYKVSSLLVEEKLNVAGEMYIGIAVDYRNGVPVAMVCAEGGVEIEELAARNPEKIASRLIDPLYGMRSYGAINLVRQAGLIGKTLVRVSTILAQLYTVFTSYDARIAEINPLVITHEGEIIAADARVEIDDNSLFRHPELKDLSIQRIENPWEREAMKGGVTYVELDGDIAVMATGAGLTMSLLDITKNEGGSPACFLDTGGGLSKERMKNGVGLLLRRVKLDPSIKVVLVMARMMMSPPDEVAGGILEAVREVKAETPVVAVMRGRKAYEERAHDLLKDSEVSIYSDIREGVREAIRIAGKENK